MTLSVVEGLPYGSPSIHSGQFFATKNWDKRKNAQNWPTILQSKMWIANFRVPRSPDEIVDEAGLKIYTFGAEIFNVQGLWLIILTLKTMSTP